MSVFDEWVREGQRIPMDAASRFLVELRRPTEPPPMPVKTAAVQAGLLKLGAIGAMEEMGVGDQAAQMEAAEKAALTDPNVQQALDYQQAVAEREEFAQAAQMAEERAAQAEQQAQMAGQQAQEAQAMNEQTQQQLMASQQEKQDAMQQAIQARDQSLKEQMVASQKREEIVNSAEDLKAQLDQIRAQVEQTQAVAAENPTEALAQQEAMAAQAQPASPEAAQAAGGPAAKEEAEAQNAQAEADQQAAQAEQAQAAQAQAQPPQPPPMESPQAGPGGQVAGAPQVPTPIGAGQPGMGGVAKQGSALQRLVFEKAAGLREEIAEAAQDRKKRTIMGGAIGSAAQNALAGAAMGLRGPRPYLSAPAGALGGLATGTGMGAGAGAIRASDWGRRHPIAGGFVLPAIVGGPGGMGGALLGDITTPKGGKKPKRGKHSEEDQEKRQMLPEEQMPKSAGFGDWIRSKLPKAGPPDEGDFNRALQSEPVLDAIAKAYPPEKDPFGRKATEGDAWLKNPGVRSAVKGVLRDRYGTKGGTELYRQHMPYQRSKTAGAFQTAAERIVSTVEQKAAQKAAQKSAKVGRDSLAFAKRRLLSDKPLSKGELAKLEAKIQKAAAADIVRIARRAAIRKGSKVKEAAEECPVTGKPRRGPGLGPGRGRPLGTGPGMGRGPGKGRGREKAAEILKEAKLSGLHKGLIAGGTALTGLGAAGTAAGVHRSREGKRLALEDTGKKLYGLAHNPNAPPGVRRDAYIASKALAKKVKEEHGRRAGKAPSWLAPKKRPTVAVEVGRQARISLGEKAQKLMPKRKTAANEALARAVGKRLGVDWDDVDFTPKDLAAGMKVEEEHNKPGVDVVPKGQVPKATAEIALAHLTEGADYYDRLKKMEAKMEAHPQPSESKKKEAAGGKESSTGGVANFKCCKEQPPGDAIRTAIRKRIMEHHRNGEYSSEFLDNPKPLAEEADRDPKEKVKEGQWGKALQYGSGALLGGATGGIAGGGDPTAVLTGAAVGAGGIRGLREIGKRIKHPGFAKAWHKYVASPEMRHAAAREARKAGATPGAAGGGFSGGGHVSEAEAKALADKARAAMKAKAETSRAAVAHEGAMGAAGTARGHQLPATRGEQVREALSSAVRKVVKRKPQAAATSPQMGMQIHPMA